jgi:cytochrome P450
VSDWEAMDFFRDDALVADPYPYFDALREQCPVRREPHHGVMMVTGYDEAVEVFHDARTFSSCLSVTGPFPGFPVPLEGDDVTGLIEQHRHELPMSDQLPTLDPPVHTDRRALLMRLITPKRLKENEASMWQLADRLLDEFLARGEGEFISGFAGPFTLLVIADLLGVPAGDQEEFARAFGRGIHTCPGAAASSPTAAPTAWAWCTRRSSSCAARAGRGRCRAPGSPW